MSLSAHLGKRLALASAIATLFASGAQAESANLNNVVTSIAPIHSLTQAVMGDLGEVQLIVDNTQSPHGFALKPSQRRVLANADVVFYVGAGLEAFMPSAIAALPETVRSEELIEAEGLTILPFREGGVWDEHSHDHGEHAHHDHENHDHDAHEEGAHEHEHEHEHGEKEAHGHEAHDGAEHEHKDHDHNHEGDHDAHEHHEGDHDHEAHEHHEHENHEGEHHEHEHHEHGAHHDHGEQDPHIWLDPQNAIHIVQEIEHVLSETYPDHAEELAHNAEHVIEDLEALDAKIQAQLDGVSGSFIVFHDAYQYFDHRYSLDPAGSITLDPENSPSAKRVSELRERLQEGDVRCVFKEPQFRGKIIETIVEGSDIAVSQLDPLGADFPVGATLYPSLLQSMADSFSDCLQSK